VKVYFVGAGPGDPELLTVKAQRLLSGCRMCIYAGSLVNPAVLNLIPVDAEKHDSAELDLEEIVSLFRSARDRDIDVIRLHSGDPSIFGAIREQMNELDKLDISYEVVPGVSSFQAAAAALQAELTAPEVSQTIILTRAEGRTPVPQEQNLSVLAATHSTLCIFLSAHKLGEIAATLRPYYGENCPVALVYRASWPDELVVRGTLADIAEKVAPLALRKTAMIVVGRTLSREIPASKLYDPAFSHEYRKGEKE